MSRITRIAIPLRNGKVTDHLGRSDIVIIYEVGPDGVVSQGSEKVDLHSRACDVVPRQLQAFGAQVVLAGRAGTRARAVLAKWQIELIIGWTITDPDQLLASYLAGERPTEDGNCAGDGIRKTA